jgi:SAM-dependent methyltransferase
MGGPSGTEGYGAEADVLAERYETLVFEQVHADVLHLMPPPPADVLDIGAGTGRDAAAFAKRGYRTVAAEPTAELRTHGQRLHAGVQITWIDDALPDLTLLRGRGQRFDLIMLTAVWMHQDAEQRRRAMPALAALLAPGGRAIMSLRHGPVPPGRRMFDVSAAETTALADASGLATLASFPHVDYQSRADVSWTVLVFERPVPRGRPLPRGRPRPPER